MRLVERTPTSRGGSTPSRTPGDGSKRSLAEVIEFYDEGGRVNPGLDPLIRPLHLSKGDKQALLAFLEALTTDESQAKR
jgi:cytochrome c peroxidase